MEFRRGHGCLRNQAMRGLRISSSTHPDAAPSLSLRQRDRVIKSSNGFLVCAAAIDRPTTPEEITIGIDVGYATCVFAIPDDAPRPIGKVSPSAKRPRTAVGACCCPLDSCITQLGVG